MGPAGPSTGALAEASPLRVLRSQSAAPLDEGARAVCGTVPCGALPPAPRPRPGATGRDHGEPQGQATAARTTALHDAHPGLPGHMTQHQVRIRSTIPLLSQRVVVDPPGTSFDAARDLVPIGHVGGDGGPLRPLACHDAAEERGQGCQGSGDMAGGCARMALSPGPASGTIPAKVVPPRLSRLVLIPEGE